MRRLSPSLRLAALVFFALALAGCGPGGAWGIAAVVVLLLALAGCSESRELAPDGGGRADAGRLVDGGADADDAGGSWLPCCESGHVSTCFCPAGVACNYGLFTTCPDGSCAPPPFECVDPS